jgi:hypothetical protein
MRRRIQHRIMPSNVCTAWGMHLKLGLNICWSTSTLPQKRQTASKSQHSRAMVRAQWGSLLHCWHRTQALSRVEAVPSSGDVKINTDTFKIHLMIDYRGLRLDGRHCEAVRSFAVASSRCCDVPFIITPNAVSDENGLEAPSTHYGNGSCIVPDMVIS